MNTMAGAMALDERGNLVLLKADSTILATGGGTRVYDISTNSSSGTGDGFAIGYRSGAELIDMEMIQFHPTGAVFPYDARGRLVTEAVRGEGGILLNSTGERFMKNYDPERMELSTRDVVARAIATEILNGRGTPHEGVYLDVTHLPREQIESRLPDDGSPSRSSRYLDRLRRHELPRYYRPLCRGRTVDRRRETYH